MRVTCGNLKLQFLMQCGQMNTWVSKFCNLFSNKLFCFPRLSKPPEKQKLRRAWSPNVKIARFYRNAIFSYQLELRKILFFGHNSFSQAVIKQHQLRTAAI